MRRVAVPVTVSSFSRARMELMRLTLPAPGAYVLRAHVLDTEGVRLFDTLERVFTVRGESREFGLVRLQHSWNGAVSPDQPRVGTTL